MEAGVALICFVRWTRCRMLSSAGLLIRRSMAVCALAATGCAVLACAMPRSCAMVLPVGLPVVVLRCCGGGGSWALLSAGTEQGAHVYMHRTAKSAGKHIMSANLQMVTCLDFTPLGLEHAACALSAEKSL